MANLAHIDNWVFDLDNTLYPADCHLFKQIDARMTAFIERRLTLDYEAARKLQKHYYVQYGATMSGLMHEHNVAPEDFLDFVHDIDLSPVAENPVLAERIDALPGRKFIFTNGSTRHAENVSGKLGVAHLFDAIFDIRHAGYMPKPHRAAYEQFLIRHKVDARAAVMFEDIAINLEAAHGLGMTTVLVCSPADWLGDEPSAKRPALPGEKFVHVHHTTNDLTWFLGAIKTSAPARAETKQETPKRSAQKKAD